MKKFLALMLALVMVLGLVACGEKAPAADDGAEAATGSVYWLNFKPESDEALQKVAALYTEKTGYVPSFYVCSAGDGGREVTAN